MFLLTNDGPSPVYNALAATATPLARKDVSELFFGSMFHHAIAPAKGVRKADKGDSEFTHPIVASSGLNPVFMQMMQWIGDSNGDGLACPSIRPSCLTWMSSTSGSIRGCHEWGEEHDPCRFQGLVMPHCISAHHLTLKYRIGRVWMEKPLSGFAGCRCWRRR
jgi:hypothetical protein